MLFHTEALCNVTCTVTVLALPYRLYMNNFLHVATSLHASLVSLLVGLSAALHAHFVDFGWLACLPAFLLACPIACLPAFLLACPIAYLPAFLLACLIACWPTSFPSPVDASPSSPSGADHQSLFQSTSSIESLVACPT